MPGLANLAASLITKIPENWPKALRAVAAALDTKSSVAATVQGGVGNGADTTEDVLSTFSLPANTLGGGGQGQGTTTALYIYASGRCAANADTKTMRLYFGSEVIATPAAATNGKNWQLELIVTRTGANTQRVTGTGQVDVTPVTPLSATGAESETAPITIKATGQAGTGNANDIICDQLVVCPLN